MKSWIQALRRDLAEEDYRDVGRVGVLLGALADGAVRYGREEYEQWRERWLQASAEQPGPGLSPLFEQFAAEIALVAQCDRDARVAVAELSVSELDGVLADAPGDGGEYLLVVHPTFPTFANLLAKACAYAIPLAHGPEGEELGTGVEGWAEALTSDVPAVQRYLELVAAALRGLPGSAPSYILPHRIAGLVPPLRDAMEMFALARLLAHLVLGHDETATRKPVPTGVGSSMAVLEFDDEQRREAFSLGLALTLATPTFAKAAPLGYWGIEVMASTVDWLRGLAKHLEDRQVAAFLGRSVFDNSLSACRDLMRYAGRSPELALASELQPALDAFRRHLAEWVRTGHSAPR